MNVIGIPVVKIEQATRIPKDRILRYLEEG